MVIGSDDRSEAAERFQAVVGVVDHRVRRALVARYGLEVGDDAAAEAMAWAWEHVDDLEAASNPAGYLFRVGQSAAKRLLRWRRSRPVFDVTAGVDTDESLLDPDLFDALTALSRDQRTAVLLVHGYGFSYRDVAEILEVSDAAVTNYVHRGLKRLRLILEDT